MVLSRKVVTETLASAVPVLLFIGVLVFISTSYTGDGITPAGGQMLVAALAGFVVVMTAVGIGLARSDYDEDAE